MSSHKRGRDDPSSDCSTPSKRQHTDSDPPRPIDIEVWQDLKLLVSVPYTPTETMLMLKRRLREVRHAPIHAFSLTYGGHEYDDDDATVKDVVEQHDGQLP